MIGKKLKELRESKGLTRKAVAKQINIDQTTYGKYELGKREPSFEIVKKLADFFQVSVDFLLDREKKYPAYESKGKEYKVTLSKKDMKKIKEESLRLKNLMMSSIGFAFDGQIGDKDTLEKVMAALEEGITLAKKEAKEKYTPKKYRK
ncbi:MAG TPA: transcriptional regulator [Clostridiaceae bacterium]|mgnify:CR=1 FL=1|nr:transcriptional regulator [Clostridiaceae bacterium]